MVQCNLCSCNLSVKKTPESRLARAPHQDRQHKTSQSNLGNQSQLLAFGHNFHGRIDSFSQETPINQKEWSIEATGQPSSVNEDTGGVGIPATRSSLLFSQASLVEDLQVEPPPTLQIPSRLLDIRESNKFGQLNHFEEQRKAIQEQQAPCNGSHTKKKRMVQVKEHRASPHNARAQDNQMCEIIPSHAFPIIDRRKQARSLESNWTPAKDPLKPKCPAVVLDCEMADVIGTEGFWREVTKLSAVDFLSGETLLDTLVEPTAKVKRWKTEITGITDGIMKEAKARGQIARGWAEARSKLWQHIDASTVLIGQSLNHDLEVLGMLHAQIVDSAILAAKAIDLPGAKTVGLKRMCKEMLNMDIQCIDGGIHDCLEDALASRELVLLFLYHPEELQAWALSKREEELTRKARRQIQKENRITAASHQNIWKGKGTVAKVQDDASNNVSKFDHDLEEDDNDEILRWEDIAEDVGWPHPDTGYDPWSD
ncbi:MAG: hypothetical protein Q9219_003200 [cf. Caloplaca sp. 3 TL-2023]